MAEAEDTEPVIFQIISPRAPVPLRRVVSLAVDYFAVENSRCQKILVDWGDGATDLLIRTRCGRAHDHHRYTKPGTYAITVTLTDATGGRAQGRLKCVVLAGSAWPALR